MAKILQDCASLFVVVFAALAAAPRAEAKAAYMDLEGTVEMAEAIAVLRVEGTAECEFEGSYWTYRQRVTASSSLVLKGELDREVVVMANKTFVCAPVEYEEDAEYLVFLERDAGQWVTVNHEMGRLRIDDFGHVEWPYEPTPTAAGGQAPLGEAIHEIEAHLRTTAECERLLASEDNEPREAVEPTEAADAAEADDALPFAMSFAIGVVGGGTAVFLGFVAGWRARGRRRAGSLG